MIEIDNNCVDIILYGIFILCIILLAIFLYTTWCYILN